MWNVGTESYLNQNTTIWHQNNLRHKQRHERQSWYYTGWHPTWSIHKIYGPFLVTHVYLYLHTSRFMIFLSSMSISLPGVATTMCTPLYMHRASHDLFISIQKDILSHLRTESACSFTDRPPIMRTVRT